jgi:hypothetical protein
MKTLSKTTLILPMALAGSMLLAQEPQRQQPPARTQVQQEAQQQTTTGKIAKSDDGKFVLIDTSGTTYDLDDQDNAKKFEGKIVKVSGTVDTTNNTIHVTEIKPAA